MTDQELLDAIKQYFNNGYNTGGVSALAEGNNPNGQGNIFQNNPGLSGISVGPSGDPRQSYLANTPGYQFAYNEGLRGIQNSAAARGTLLTGGTLKALQRFGTGLADQTYGNAVDRLRDFATLGQRTATASF